MVERAPCRSQDRQVADQFPQKTNLARFHWWVRVGSVRVVRGRYCSGRLRDGIVSTCILFYEHLYCRLPTAIFCGTSYDKCTYCKLLWIKDCFCSLLNALNVGLNVNPASYLKSFIRTMLTVEKLHCTFFVLIINLK